MLFLFCDVYCFIVCQVRSVPVWGTCSSCTVVWVQEPQSETFVLATRSSFKGLMRGPHHSPYQSLKDFMTLERSGQSDICLHVCHVMCCLSGGWSNLDWWSLSFDGCRNIQWRWSVTRGAGCLDSIPVAIVMMRSAAKQAGFKALSVCLVWLMVENKSAYNVVILQGSVTRSWTNVWKMTPTSWCAGSDVKRGWSLHTYSIPHNLLKKTVKNLTNLMHLPDVRIIMWHEKQTEKYRDASTKDAFSDRRSFLGITVTVK